jgi:hypothetical protein
VLDRQPFDRPPDRPPPSLALPAGPFDRRFAVNCAVRLGADGDVPRHAQPRNAAEVRRESKGWGVGGRILRLGLG